MKMLDLVGMAKNSTLLLSDFGPLRQYLLAADTYMAVLVELLTIMDMGNVIHNLEARSRSGLQQLLYLPDPLTSGLPTQEEVTDAFRRFYNDVGALLTDEEVAALSLEHYYC